MERLSLEQYLTQSYLAGIFDYDDGYGLDSTDFYCCWIYSCSYYGCFKRGWTSS